MPIDHTQTEPPPAVAEAAARTPPVVVTAIEDPPLAGLPAASPGLAPPGYVIERELARGGMGVVYLARQVGLNRPCALKMMLGPGAGVGAQRFLAEAEAIAAVKHPQVVQVYDFGRHADAPYLAMELCPGGTLAHRLAAGRMTPTAAALLVAGLAEAVGAAHAAGVVHRDLKPGNVLFDAAGVAKVADFGLAKRDGGAGLTRTEALMGTPAYMSPEQAKGEAKFAGPPSDVWALGVILYECLTGARPFAGDSALQVMDRVIADTPASVRVLAPEVPRDLELIGGVCLRKEPHERYATAGELAADLRRLLAGQPVRARPVPAAVRAWKWVRRNPGYAGLWAGLAAALVLGSAASLGFGLRARAEARRADAELARANDATADALRSAADAREQSQRAEQRKSEAEAEAARANEVTEVMTGLFRSTDPFVVFTDGLVPAEWEKQRTKPASDVLREMVPEVRGRLADQPLTRARLLASIGNSFRNAGMFRDAEPLLVEAQELRRQHLPADDLERANGELELGHLQLDQGDFVAALDRFRAVAGVFRRAAGQEARWLTARVFEGWALGMLSRGEAPDVAAVVVADGERLLGPHHRITLLARLVHMGVLLELGRGAEVLPLLEPIRAGVEAQPDGQVKTLTRLMFRSMFAVSQSLVFPGVVAIQRQAEQALREVERDMLKALPDSSIYVAVLRLQLALMAGHAGRHDECLRILDRVMADARQTVGLAHPKGLMLAGTYAQIAVGRGRPDDARAVLAEIERAMAERFGAGSLWHTHARLDRVWVEAMAGEYETAADLTRQVLAGDTSKLAATRLSGQRALRAAQELRDSPASAGKEAAVELFRLARRLAAGLAVPDQEVVFFALRDEAGVLMNLNRPAEARPLLDQAVALAASPGVKLDADDRGVLAVRQGRLAAREGRAADAEAAFREAVRTARGYVAADRDRVEWAWELAGVLCDAGRPADAAAELEKVRRTAAAPDLPAAWVDRKQTAELLFAKTGAWLAECRLRAGDRAGYSAALGELRKRFQQSADAGVLTPVAWAAGLAADQTVWPAGELADALAKSRGSKPPGQAERLLRVRLGGLGPEKPDSPIDHLLVGLAATDRTTARKHLDRATELLASGRLNDRHWTDRLAAAVLADELRAKAADERAPPPRPAQ